MTRIAVLRGGGLGDLVFALPALRAVRARYPAAEITLIGHGWQAPLAAALGGPVDEVVDLPGEVVAWLRGLGDAALPEAFLAPLRQRQFDLAVQLHGGGARSNLLVAGLGATRTIGLQAPGAPPLDETIPYRYWQSEVMRALEVVGLVGAVPIEIEPRIDPPGRDADAAMAILDQALERAGRGPGDRRAGRPLVVVAPGAGDGRRRWPARRFGEAAHALATAADAVVAVSGTSAEGGLAAEIVARCASAVDLTGRLTVAQLAGLLARASLVVANDSGPLHLAAAVGTPTVGIFWCGNLINAGRAFRARYLPLLSWRLDCPTCGTNAMLGRCAHEASFVADIPVSAVVEAAREFVPAQAFSTSVRTAYGASTDRSRTVVGTSR